MKTLFLVIVATTAAAGAWACSGSDSGAPGPAPIEAPARPDATEAGTAPPPDRCTGVSTVVPTGAHGDPNGGNNGGVDDAGTYRSVPFPAENPYAYEKAILGKILFWEEQLSSDDTVACGTCHRPSAGGADPRATTTRHPGADGLLGSADDVHGSAGVKRCDDSTGTVVHKADPVFGTNVQVTGRKAPSYLDAMFAPALFWDGRAGSELRDPLDPYRVLIASGAALENQALGPPMNDAEMACEGRTWPKLTAKLAAATPLAKARALPADMATAVCKMKTYAELFQFAFGTPEITPGRIAMAIATHERTLISNQTPYDRDLAGDTTALTAAQKHGRDVYFGRPSVTSAQCVRCHQAPNFAFNAPIGNQFANLGFQPEAELAFDPGRAKFTMNVGDRGKFRSVGLRNVGLREAAGLLHDGRSPSSAGSMKGGALDSVVLAYNAPPNLNTNTHPGMTAPLGLSQAELVDLVDFLRNGLTDPRVAQEKFPFDRPKLSSE